MNRAAIGAILLLLLLTSGCVTRVYLTPEHNLRVYRDALKRADGERVWPHLSTTAKARTSKQGFLARFHEQGRRLSRSDTVDRLVPRRGHLTSRLFVASKVVILGRYPGGWLIEAGILNYFSQRTPREALHSFIRALTLHRADVLYAMMPNTFRTAWDLRQFAAMLEKNRKRVTDLAAALERHKHSPITITGQRAVMPYGVRQVRFLFENGRWKVYDPD